MIKLNYNSNLLQIINKKNIFFFLVFLLINNCSFDNKTGIWGDSEKEKRKISEIEKKQKEIIDVEKIYSSEFIYNKEKKLVKNISLSKPQNNQSWPMSSMNHQNFLGNIRLSGIDNVFLKKKIGKDKFLMHKSFMPLLFFKDNIILSDDSGTIFNITKRGKINWKKNIYKKVYKKIYKNLVLSIYENNIYVADNIGFIYAINFNTGELVWIKNYGVPFKSNMKIFNDKLFLIDQDNKILCFNVNDGSLIWNILSIESFIKSQNLLSLAISKQGELFALTSSADIFKIIMSTGRIIWSRNTAGSMYANATDFFNTSGIVLTDNEVIFSSNFTIFSFDANNGELKWKNELDSVSVPIVDGKTVFTVTHNGFFVILNKNTGEIISSTNILKILKEKHQNTVVKSFILGSGKVYSITSNGFIIVNSAISGKTEYFRKVGSANISNLIINNGSLYFIAEKSKLIGFN